MNPGMKVRYEGDLRCSAVHLKSGKTLTTDAPPDNNGKGEAFSPTDLLCTSLAVCMITLMGIAATKKDLVLGEIEADIEKVMANDPRRVSEIYIHFRMERKDLDEKERMLLERVAHTCPVARSIHPDILQRITFEYY
jgi:putative redox protein